MFAGGRFASNTNHALITNLIMQKCAKRVEADETGEAHCTGQYFDYWKCIDKCVCFHHARPTTCFKGFIFGQYACLYFLWRDASVESADC